MISGQTYPQDPRRSECLHGRSGIDALGPNHYPALD